MNRIAGLDRTVRQSLLIGVATLAVLAGTGGVRAATWAGGSGDFGTASNWNNGNGPTPGTADTGTINSGTATVTTSQTVGTVNIGGTGTVNVNASGSLQVTTLKVNSGGTLDIGLGRTVTATTTNIAGTVTGDGTLAGGAITQSAGTLDVDAVTASTYTLTGTGQITGGEVSFSDSFSLQTTGQVLSGVEVTGDGSATVSQGGSSEMAGTVTGITDYTHNGGTMSGSVTASGTYEEKKGTMSGAVGATDYKLSGGSIEGTAQADATVGFGGAFTLSGTGEIGSYATITGDEDSTFTQTNGTQGGSVEVFSYAQQGGTMSGDVDTTDYKLSGGTVDGTTVADATVGFSGTFTLSGSGKVGSYATITGGGASTFTQTNSTMSGSVDVGDYKLSGGTIDGTALDAATVDFDGNFTLSGSGIVGSYATITGGAASTFTQSNGSMGGSADVNSYVQQGGTMSGRVKTADYKLSGGTVDGTTLADATVGFSGTFTLWGSGSVGSYATITGGDASIFTQTGGTMGGAVDVGDYRLSGGTIDGTLLDAATVDFDGNFTLSGSGSVGSYATITGGDTSIFTQTGGTMAGAVDVGDYKLSSGSIDGTSVDAASVDFAGAFTLSGSGSIGTYATITGGDGSTFTQTNGSMAGNVEVDTYAQQRGTMTGAVDTTDYKLSGGSVDGTLMDAATVDFSGTFTLSGNGGVGTYAAITGGDASTFTQTNGSMAGSVSAATYAQQGGTMQGAVDVGGYKLTGGTIDGTALAAATVDFTGAFNMSGNSTIGAYATITGDTGSVFTQTNGSIEGGVSAATYKLGGGSMKGAVDVADFELTGGSIDGTALDLATVDFTGDFTMSGNATIGTYATITGETGSTFTQRAGTIYGGLSLDSYAINDCTSPQCALVAAGATIDAATAFDVSAETGVSTIAGKLTGTGALAKSGGSTLVLSGDDNDYTGATSVTGGVLQVDGAITKSATTVSAGTLTGTGSLAAVTISAGGTHAAGDDGIGTQTINGNYVNHGTLVVEVQPDAADKLVVNGTVDIAGATLDIRGLTGDGWQPTNTFTIIDNDGSDAVTGTFGSILSDLAFLTPSIDTTTGGNDVVLQMLRNDMDFSGVAETGNQRAVADAIEDLGVGNPLYDTLLWQDAASSREIFDQASGEVFASAKGILLGNAGQTTDALLDRAELGYDQLDQTAPVGYAADAPLAGDAPARAWGAGYGAWQQVDGDGNASAASGSTGGLLAGLDGQVGDWTVGLAAGVGQSAVSVPDLHSEIASTDVTFGAYASRQWEQLELALGASHTHHDLTSNRQPALPQPADLTADYSAGTTQLFGRVGLPVDLGAFKLTPYGEASYVRLDTGAIEETGGLGALTSAASTVDATFAQLGLSVAASQHIGDGRLLRLRADAAWKHRDGAGIAADNAFVDGGSDFTVEGAAIDGDSLAAGLGLDLDMSDALQFRLSYDGDFAAGSATHKLSGGIVGAF